MAVILVGLTFSLSDGNGFKTSTMRLGADVIVFSRHRNRLYIVNIFEILVEEFHLWFVSI